MQKELDDNFNILNPRIKAKFLETIQNFRLIDDCFMVQVFKDKQCCEFLLKEVLGRGFTVSEIKERCYVKSLRQIGILLDLMSVDENNARYRIKLVIDDEYASVGRTDFSFIENDEGVTHKEYGEIVIYITKQDIFGGELPKYYIKRVILETGVSINDGNDVICVNSQVQDGSALGSIMSDFYCVDADNMKNDILSDAVKYFKESAKGVELMCEAIENLCKEIYGTRIAETTAMAMEEGLAEGRRKGMADGRRKGREEGREDGLAQGHEEGKAAGKEEGLGLGMQKGLEIGLAEGNFLANLNAIKKIVEKMSVDANKAMEILDIEPDKRNEYLARL